MPVGDHESDATLSSRAAVSDDGVELAAQRMSSVADVPPLLELDDSEWDELVSRARKWAAAGTETAERRELRIDSEHTAVSPAVAGNICSPSEDRVRVAPRWAAGFAGGLAWLGLAIMVSGAALAVQSHLAHRAELWNISLPLVVGGVATALLGLALCWSVRADALPAGRFDARGAGRPLRMDASGEAAAPHGASSARSGATLS